MKAKNHLNVWYEKKLVGTLSRNSIDLIGFHYDKDWLSNGFAISQQLPLSIPEYLPTTGTAHRFFANLLPEANARMHIVRDLKISNSDFELLAAIGGECAGALSILPENHAVQRKPRYRKLTAEDLEKILLRRGNITSFISDENRPRLSLAGAQDKCAIYFEKNEYFLPCDA